LTLGKIAKDGSMSSPANSPFLKTEPGRAEAVLIAVARDAAFSFYYEDNLDLLRAAGAEICFFSPQRDPDLPAGTSGIYLGGGFPEIYAAQLAANESLQNALRHAYVAGLPIYAECGGFMYLTEAIIDLESRYHPMVGLIPGVTHMQPRLVSLGYRLVESPTGNFLLPKGVTTRGHEFHWSIWKNSTKRDETYATPAPAWHIRPRSGEANSRAAGYATGNLIASYVHLHFAHNLQLAHNFVQASRRWMQLHGA
jgi:cobyrinic acid a,c-diamide synthase